MNPKIVFCVLVSIVLLANVQCSSKAAYKVLRKIFKGYSSTGPPQLSPNDTTHVYMNMYAEHVDLDDSTQTLKLNAILCYFWVDAHLNWSPSENSGLKFIRVPSIYMWRPDIDVFNGRSIGMDGSNKKSYIVLHYTGHAYWCPAITTSTHCSLDHKKYPYDEQTCMIKIGSWSYTQSELDLHPATNYQNLSSFGEFKRLKTKNPIWSFNNYTEQRTIEDWGEMGKYVDIAFYIKLTRNSPLYNATIVTPIGVAALMALLMFFLPPGHSQKLTTGVVSLVMLTILMVHLAWKLPSMSTVPKAVSLCRTTFIAVSASMLCAVILMSLSQGALPFAKEPPAVLVNVLQGILGKILCICYSGDAAPSVGAYKRTISSNGENDDRAYLSDVIQSTRQVDEWKLIAAALDRLLLIIFSLTFIITSLSTS